MKYKTIDLMKTKTILFVTLCMFIFAGVLEAQPGGRFSKLRDRVSNARYSEIARRLQLDFSDAEKLRPVYLAYEQEKALILNGQKLRDLDISPDSLTDEQAEKIYFITLDKAKKMIALREKYYHEFNKVLKPTQILKFNRIEGEINKKMLQDIRQRMDQRIPK